MRKAIDKRVKMCYTKVKELPIKGFLPEGINLEAFLPIDGGENRPLLLYFAMRSIIVQMAMNGKKAFNRQFLKQLRLLKVMGGNLHI